MTVHEEVVDLISKMGARTASDLAKRLGLSLPRVSAVLLELKRKGLLRRYWDYSGRNRKQVWNVVEEK